MSHRVTCGCNGCLNLTGPYYYQDSGSERMQPDTDTKTAAYVVAVVAALVVSAVLAPVVWDYGTRSEGSVAVVPIQGFVSSSSVDAVAEDLREARQNESIDAVVLKVDSPGGSAAASERLYMAVQRTAQELPVVASVQSMGASGAYYGMLPAERIYVTPSSMVGSVGVRGVVPAPTPSYEVRSGPDKASAMMRISPRSSKPSISESSCIIVR